MNVRSRFARPAERGAHPQPRYAFLRQRGASDHYDGRPLLPAIHAPTVIMHGRADRTARYRMAEELHAGITGSTLIEFAGDHVFPLSAERPRFVAEVTKFLAG
jgi:pimeloyl-ACP methyl ester carboxylesterase